MHALLTAIVMWLSINLGLPPIYEHPHVEFASAAEMAQVRHRRIVALRGTNAIIDLARSDISNTSSEVHAIYDDASRTIYLAKGWTGTTPAELSMLVHEMVHHLQNIGGLRFECAQAREKAAYAAQERWLGLFGSSLKKSFDFDRMTVLLRTKCMF